MATRYPPEKGEPVPEPFMQQSMIQQAQAAAAAQTNTAGSMRQEALLKNTDLITPDGVEDDTPPPAYSDIHGEIRNEKDGLGTSASVTDDGRVNIRINQFNNRLSQIFTPALRQHVESVQNGRPPPPPYIPPFLGGEEGVPPPPPLNVVIQVVGSRGDVQPFVALGKILKDTYGHRVRLATHPTFKDFVQENGLEFFSIGGDPSQLMAFMVKNPGLMPGFRSLVSGDVGRRRKDVADYIQGCWRSCYRTGDGTTDDDVSEIPGDDTSSARPFVADCIIANPPSFAHIHCAEKLGIPLYMPYSPSQVFPHPLANITSSNADPQLTNYISYAMIEVLAWQGLGDIINRFRAKCLGLDPISVLWATGMLQRLKIPHTYCWSPSLIPKPKDWGPHISISGFYFLNLASNYTPTPELQAFLDAGPPPVYIGFGSIILENPDAMTELIFEAVRKTGQRVLLSKGWGGIGADELSIPDGVFMLGNVPHDWLFKQVSCVVHHGGAGTTAAGITAGK
jgi:UDP:flavonoid glycosyltransferase YjiC (YdhE family)